MITFRKHWNVYGKCYEDEPNVYGKCYEEEQIY